MNFIKKFAKEISVFGVVLVIFLGLLIYRNATFKGYITTTQTQVQTKLDNKDNFVLVLGSGTDDSTTSFKEVMETFTTKNRDTDLYFLDVDSLDDKTFVSDVLDVNVTYPATLIIKEGKVATTKSGSLQYYYLKDFIVENK